MLRLAPSGARLSHLSPSSQRAAHKKQPETGPATMSALAQVLAALPRSTWAQSSQFQISAQTCLSSSFQSIENFIPIYTNIKFILTSLKINSHCTNTRQTNELRKIIGQISSSQTGRWANGEKVRFARQRSGAVVASERDGWPRRPASMPRAAG